MGDNNNNDDHNPLSPMHNLCMDVLKRVVEIQLRTLCLLTVPYIVPHIMSVLVIDCCLIYWPTDLHVGRCALP